jgi:hypothetical protein
MRLFWRESDEAIEYDEAIVSVRPNARLESEGGSERERYQLKVLCNT